MHTQTLTRRPEFSLIAPLYPVAAILLALLVLLAASPAQGQGDDKPFPVPDPVTQAWQLKVEHGEPSTVAVTFEDGTVRWYWYLTYKVTNPVDEPVLFLPHVVVTTDKGDLITTDRGIRPLVYNTILGQLQNPLLETPVKASGTVLRGDDFAKETLAVWPVPDHDVDSMTVFVSGIYGEVKPVTDPVTGEPKMREALDPVSGETLRDEAGDVVMEPVLATRTLALTYATPGTPKVPERVPVRLVEKTDVMR